MLTASINKLNQVMGELLDSVHAIQADMHKGLDSLKGRPVEGDKADPKLDALQVSHSTQEMASGMHPVLVVKIMHQALCRKP